MNESNYLILSDLDDGQRLLELVRPLCSSALCAGSGRLPSSAELRKATLILVSEADPHLAMVLDHLALSPSTPILVLGSGGGLPAAALRLRERRLIDYLRVPVSRLILEQRLVFLSQVQRMSSEQDRKSVV